MYVRVDELFPAWYADFAIKLRQYTQDGIVFVGEDGNIRFLDDKLEQNFGNIVQGVGKPLSYFHYFFGLDVDNTTDSVRIEQVPLYKTLKAARRDGRSYTRNQPWPVVLTPNGLAHMVETHVREMPGIGKYIAMEIWSKMSDQRFWAFELRRHEPKIIKV